MNTGDVPRGAVVIVGAGPTGITAATLLAQYDLDCLLLDRWPAVYPQPRAVHLDDEVYRILARLGVADEFASISRPTRGLRLLGADFGLLAQFDRDQSHAANGFPQANMFDQPELESLLRANLKRYPNARLCGNSEVTEIADGADGICVTFTDRSDGQVHQVHADYVLGCDGANSMVRTHIGATMRDLHFEQRWLVVDVATEADLGQWEGVHQVCDPARAATYMRVGDARYRWEFQLLAGETAENFGTLDALRSLIAPWTARAASSDLTVLRVAEYTFHAQIADGWRRGNVFILGDAAHLTPPFIGQGLGAGVRDAANLAWKLAAVHHGRMGAEALDSYEQERAPHTRQMIRLALGVGWAMTGGGRAGDVARRLLLPRLRFIPGLRHRIVDSTTPALHCSALVDNSRRRGRLSGRLCPNPLLRDGRRLDDALGVGFGMVTMLPPAVADDASLRRRGVVVLIPQPGDDLATWLRRGRASAAVVRPDRTVARAGRDVAALCAWTTEVLRERR